MSKRFDDEVETSWGQFEERVRHALTRVDDSTFAVDVPGATEETGAFPYVQFAGDGDLIRAEVSSNEVLDVESPNWWFEVRRSQAAVVPTMVTATFRQVFGILHPDFLASEQLTPATESEPVATEAVTDDGCDGDAVIAYPDCRDHLVRMVQSALSCDREEPAVRDNDGDFPICGGEVPIWIRIAKHEPMVQMFSYLVSSVRNVRQARIEVALLNQRQDYFKFVLTDRMIVASVDLPAAPFVGPLFRYTLDLMVARLDEIANDTAVRVSGRLWFDAAATQETRPEGSV